MERAPIRRRIQLAPPDPVPFSRSGRSPAFRAGPAGSGPFLAIQPLARIPRRHRRIQSRAADRAIPPIQSGPEDRIPRGGWSRGRRIQFPAAVFGELWTRLPENRDPAANPPNLRARPIQFPAREHGRLWGPGRPCSRESALSPPIIRRRLAPYPAPSPPSAAVAGFFRIPRRRLRKPRFGPSRRVLFPDEPGPFARGRRAGPRRTIPARDPAARFRALIALRPCPFVRGRVLFLFSLPGFKPWQNPLIATRPEGARGPIDELAIDRLLAGSPQTPDALFSDGRERLFRVHKTSSRGLRAKAALAAETSLPRIIAKNFRAGARERALAKSFAAKYHGAPL